MWGGKTLLVGVAATAAVATTTTTTSSTSMTKTGWTSSTGVGNSNKGGGTPTPTPIPTPTPPPTSVTVPAGYTVKQASGLHCDGVTDDTAALRSNLGSLASYQALQLPAGTCVTSNILILQGKTNVMIFGAGKDSTVIKATNPAYGAFVATQDNGVILQGFQIYSPNAASRLSDGNACGFYIFNASNVTLDGVKSTKVAAAGILLSRINTGIIQNSEVNGSLADGFHVTGASQNVTVRNNLANGVGDDAFASIGYANSGQNQNIRFLNNVAQDGWWAGGIDFSGTNGGEAIGNKVYRSGIGCIEVANPAAYPTYGNDNISLQNNYCEGNVTRTNTGHAAIMLYVTYANGHAHGVTASGNTIVNPANGAGVRAVGYSATSNIQASFSNTTMTGVQTPYSIGAYASVAH